MTTALACRAGARKDGISALIRRPPISSGLDNTDRPPGRDRRRRVAIPAGFSGRILLQYRAVRHAGRHGPLSSAYRCPSSGRAAFFHRRATVLPPRGRRRELSGAGQSLPGTTSVMVRTSNGMCWGALPNTRTQPSDTINTAIDQMVWDMVNKVPDWNS